MKIPGLIFDGRLTFRAHTESLMARLKVRHGVLARLAWCTWGLETHVLRVTH